MNGILLLLLMWTGVLMLVRVQAALVVTAVLGVVLATLALGVNSPSLGLWLLWGVLLVYTVPQLRRPLISQPVLTRIRHLMPTISDTEQQALDAGTTWWETDLFSGKPDWHKLLTFPKPQLSPEEQSFLDGPTEALCRQLDDWVITHELHDLPPAVWDTIRREGFLGMIIPKSYGGLGFSHQAHSAVVGKIASRSVSAAVTVMVPNSLGPAELLLQYGTEEQKSHYLPRLASGQEIPCFALTGPDAGSDAASIPDTGIVCWGNHQGQEVLGLRMNWDKRYITLAPVATVVGLAFRLLDPDHLLGEKSDVGITLALIPSSHSGIEIGRRHFPAGQAFMNGPIQGKDVFIPLEWVIGGRAQCGRGWMMLMNCLAAGRSISLPALGTASTKMAARLSGAYSRVRQQFHLPIGQLEGVEEALAIIGTQAYTLEAARRLTCVGLDMGEKPAVIGGIMKYQATERMRIALNLAMDIHGGKGICEGPSNYLATAYHALPVGITVEGANILTRTLIVFGQGALRCHPFLQQEVAAAAMTDQRAGLAAFDQAFTGHIGHIIGNAARAFGHGVTGAIFAHAPRTPNAACYRQLSRMSAAFALAADAALGLLGGELKRKEKLSGRFADCLSELYLGSAVLKRWHDDDFPIEDEALVDSSVAAALYHCQQQLCAILDNFPSALVGGLLRCLIFPWGRTLRAPSDALGHQVAALMLSPSPSFERLSEGVFISQNPAEATGALEHAFALVVGSRSIVTKVRKAVQAGLLPSSLPEAALAAGVITGVEADVMRQTAAAVHIATRVDDFSIDILP